MARFLYNYVVGFKGVWTNDAYPMGTAYVIKYEADGSELWNKSFKLGFWNIANGIAIDSNDNIILAIGTYSGGIPWHSCWIVKCNGNTGNEIWNKTFSQTIEDLPFKIAIDSKDNIIVVGGSLTPYWFNYFSGGWLTLKYDKDGNLLWNQRFLDKEQAKVKNVAIDAENNLIITGFKLSRYNNPNKNSIDFYTLKINKNGEILWKNKYDFGQEDRIYGVIVDKNNSIIVAGFSSADKQIIDQRSNIPAIIAYNKNGKLIGIKKLNFDGKIYDIVFDNKDEILITGSVYKKGLTEDYFTAKYSDLSSIYKEFSFDF